MALQFPPLAMCTKAVLANELAAVSTELLHFSLPTLVTLCLLGVADLLQGLPYLKKVLDVESGGQVGHAPLGEGPACDSWGMVHSVCHAVSPPASPDRPRRRCADTAVLLACGTPLDTQNMTAGLTASPVLARPHYRFYMLL